MKFNLQTGVYYPDSLIKTLHCSVAVSLLALAGACDYRPTPGPALSDDQRSFAEEVRPYRSPDEVVLN